MSKFNTISITQIVVCLLVVMMGSAPMVSFGVFIPYYVDTFQADVSTISLAVSIVLLVIGLISPVVGRLLDRYSVRAILLFGGAALLAGFICASLSGSVTQILLCYLLLGIGAGIFAPLVTVKHMTVWFPDRLGLATSLICLPVAAVVFPLATQWLIDNLEWRRSLQVYAAVAALVTALLVLLRAAPGNSGAHSDRREFAETPKGSARLSSFAIYKPLLKSPLFWFVLFGFSAYLAAPVSVMTHFIVLCQNKGFAASDGVFLLTVMGMASLIGGPVSGLLCDRFGPRFAYIMLAVFQGVALSLLLGRPSYSLLLTSSVILGFFMSASYIAFAAFSARVINPVNFGTGFGLATLLVAIVGAFPPFIAGKVYDLQGSYDPYFIVVVGLTLLSGVIAMFIGPVKAIGCEEDKAAGEAAKKAADWAR